MNIDELRKLLRRQEPEGIKLDFKQELHAINHPDKKVRVEHWNELIKDILALANGNVGTARQAGYLIIGVADKLNKNGIRDLYDVGDIKLSGKEILTKVNNVCNPPLPTIYCETIILDGKRLLIIKIPPTPYLHETIRPLTVPSQVTYQEHAVFIRRKEDIGLASILERQAILAEKQNIIPELSKRRSKSTSSFVTFPKITYTIFGRLIFLSLLICGGLFCFSMIVNSSFFATVPQEKPTQGNVPTNFPQATINIPKTMTSEPNTPTLIVLPSNIPISASATFLPQITLLAQRSMTVDNWEVRVERIELAQSMTFNGKIRKAAGRFALLFLAVTNRGLSPDTFVAFGTVDVINAQHIRYKEDAVVSFYAYVQYNTDIGAEINPDATENVVAAFDISKQGTSYTLIPGSLAKSSLGTIILQIP